MILGTDGVTGAEILETYGCADVTGLHEIDRVLVVGVHLIETCYPLLLAGTCIEHVSTGVKMSGVSSHIGETTYERIGCNLEHETCERLGS